MKAIRGGYYGGYICSLDNYNANGGTYYFCRTPAVNPDCMTSDGKIGECMIAQGPGLVCGCVAK